MNIDASPIFKKTYNELSIALKELPRKNYGSISIECSPIDTNLDKVEAVCSNSSDMEHKLNCTCGKLRAATKYRVSLLTKKNEWNPSKKEVSNEYTSNVYNGLYFI